MKVNMNHVYERIIIYASEQFGGPYVAGVIKTLLRNGIVKAL